jgi:F-type H+-transporting ATPase subunit c
LGRQANLSEGRKTAMRKLGMLAFWVLVVMVAPLAALAEEASESLAQAVSTGMPFLGYALGAGIAAGFAGLGCGIGQGLTAGNTTAGIARNPGAAGQMNTPFILGMVLIESIAIYGLLIGLLLWLKLP